MDFISVIVNFFDAMYNASMKTLPSFVGIIKNVCPMRSSGLRGEKVGVSYSSDSLSQVCRTYFTGFQGSSSPLENSRCKFFLCDIRTEYTAEK